MLRVGLTGGIASGKSTILRMMGQLGCRTVDADSIVASLYRPGHAGHEALVRTYGNDVLLESGGIDRARLARLAFSAPEEARRLNALIHPLVVEEQQRLMAQAEQEGAEIYVVEATLLVESGGRERFDRLVVVDVSPEVQVERGVSRGMEREEVLRRIAHQMPREERLRHADYVIVNDGSEEEARRQVSALVSRLRDDLAEKQRAPGVSPGP